MRIMIVLFVILVMLLRIAIVKKHDWNYEKERSQYLVDNQYNTANKHKYNASVIPITNTAVAYLPEDYSHRSFMKKRRTSFLRKYNPLLRKFITEDKERWKLSVLKFHGRLIDQFRQPIPNANVGIIIRYRSGGGGLFGASGNSAYDYSVYAKTDENGYFSLDKVVGQEFSVIVISAEGYIFKKYLYSSDIVNEVNTTSLKPYDIKGWKIQDATSLRQIKERTLRFPDKIKPNNDGSLYTAFLNDKSDEFFVAGSDRDITVSVVSNNDGEIARDNIKTTYEIKINDGGLIEVEDSDFPYKAPEVGYQSSVKQSFQSRTLENYRGRSGLVTYHEQYYYVALLKPKRYGLLKIYIDPHFRNRLNFSATFRINEHGLQDLLGEFELNSLMRRENFVYKQYEFKF